MTTRPKLYLIDGSGYIFRAYYAVRPLSTRAGVPTNAVVGFAKMLGKLLREAQPKLLGIAFDPPEKNFRHAIYSDYKANREAPPEDLAPQFPLIHALVESLQIPLLIKPGFEADDVLGSLARQGVAAGHDVVLVSADKDLMQLVNPHVTMFDPMKDKLFAEADVQERFGVPPSRVADVLALAGDTSDNIPGVPKVGPKTASKLVTQYGDVEAVIAALAQAPKRRAVEEAVVVHQETARLSKRLTVIDVHTPIPLALDGLTYSQPDRARLATFLRKIEAFGMMRDFGLSSDEANDAANEAEPAPIPETTPIAGTAPAAGAAPHITVQATLDRSAYRTITSLEALGELLNHAEQAKTLSVDLETTSLMSTRANIVGVALAVPGQVPAYVPVAHHYLGVPRQLAAQAVLDVMRPMLEGHDVAKVGQNLKYDWVVFNRAGVTLRHITEDSMLGAYVLDPGRASFGMDALAREFLGHETIRYNDVTGTGKNRIGFEEVPVEDATRYAAEDADVALRLCGYLRPLINQANANGLYDDIEIPLVPVLAQMEAHGVFVDHPQLSALAHEFNRRLVDIENEAFAQIGSPINLGSPKQLAHLFFEKLGYPVIKKTRTGYSTDQEVLETLARTYDLPRIILNHRLLTKLKSTYVDALPKMLNPATGRVHTSFNQTGTATGRLSSSDPNLQNIPIRSDDGKRIRAAFAAAPGCEIISADYSQIELRIMAHLSQDEHFIDAFVRGEDIHQRTAQEILAGGATPTPDMRRRAKAINFGILYGLSEFGLSRQLGIPRAEAHAYIAAYFARYPQIRHFLDGNIQRGAADGYVTTIGGRRRYLPNLTSKNGNIRQGAERIAMNTPIQGSAADIIKLAMLKVTQRLKAENLQARLVLQVHDELVVEAPTAERAQVVALLREEMTQVLSLRVPLVVDVGHGANWAAAH